MNALDRITAYLRRRGKSRQDDQLHIHGYDMGCDSEAILSAEDLAALVDLYAATLARAERAEKRIDFLEGMVMTGQGEQMKLAADLLQAKIERSAERDALERAETLLAEAVEALDNLIDAITATDQIGDRKLVITGSTANLKWLLEAEEDARATLAKLEAEHGTL